MAGEIIVQEDPFGREGLSFSVKTPFREYGKASETIALLASAPRLQEQNKRLRSALQGMLAMYDKLNWGASFLNAEDIRLMNEAPIAARAALGEE